MWATIIVCLAELAAGYLESSSSQNDQQYYQQNLQKLAEIQDNLQRLAADIQNVMKEIRQAVEMVNREIHESAMLDHFSDMQSYAALIAGNFQQLNKMAHEYPEQNNLENSQVREWVTELTSHRDNLFRSVNAFAAQDGGSIGKHPTIQTFVCCSPSIAMWAKAYQVIDSYNPANLRIPVYQHSASKSYQTTLAGFFKDVEQLVADDDAQLYGPLLAPDRDQPSNKLLKYANHTFSATDVPFQAEYPGELQYDRLFNWHIFGSGNAKAGLYGTRLKGTKCVWERWPENDAAHLDCVQLQSSRKPFLAKNDVYAPILAQQNNVMALFERPTFSDRISLRAASTRGISNRDEAPTFYINVVNEGPEATVVVTEYVNPNEPIEVLRKMIPQNGRVDDVECVGTGYKKFHWKNVGSGNEGDSDKADGLTLTVDPQG